jgi:hypothetical protein
VNAINNLSGFHWLILTVIALGSLNAGCSATTPGKQSASTGTALRAINDKINDGTIKIEADTDSAPPH